MHPQGGLDPQVENRGSKSCLVSDQGETACSFHCDQKSLEKLRLQLAICGEHTVCRQTKLQMF